MSNPGIIYVVSHLSDPERIRYVGKTQRALEVRSKEHWASSRTRPSGAFLQWLRKNAEDPEAVWFREYAKAEDIKALNELEVATISLFKSQGMADLNLAPGGAGTARGRPQKPTPLTGERHPMHKLTWGKVNEIRQRRMQEFIPAILLAEQYGVETYAIRNVLYNKTWKDPGFDPKSVIPYDKSGYHSGDRNAGSKLSEDAVSVIRKRCLARRIPLASLAEEFGVKAELIQRVLDNRTYIDPTFDPALLPGRSRKAAVLTAQLAKEVRDYFLDRQCTQKEVAKVFGLKAPTTSLLLRNKIWYDPDYVPPGKLGWT